MVTLSNSTCLPLHLLANDNTLMTLPCIFLFLYSNPAIITTDASEDSWRKGLKQQDVPGLNFFEMNTIETATNNFSLSNKLGQGGFGSVYKVR